jgi:hypothetical protein
MVGTLKSKISFPVYHTKEKSSAIQKNDIQAVNLQIPGQKRQQGLKKRAESNQNVVRTIGCRRKLLLLQDMT